MYSVSQVVFFLLFFGMIFLLLIFGETTVGILFLGLLVSLCVMAARHVQLERVEKFKWPLVLFGAFVISTFLSLLTTVSIPLTVNAAMFYGASYVVFFFLLTSDPRWLPTQLFLVGSSILTVIFAALTILYTLFPHLAVSLPSVTLLTAQYGHNQAAVLFLLMLPILWHFADTYRSFMSKLGVVVVCVALILSFSRISSILTVAELIFLLQLTKDRTLRTLGKILLTVLVLAVIFVGVLSVYGRQVKSSCVIPLFQSQLCKPIHTELRPAYWSQAVRATLDSPLSGWGGGTFSLLSPLYQKKYGEFSGYAHNEVLQAFAEYGFFGGVSFGLFIGCLLLKAASILRRNKQTLLLKMSLAVIAVVITSFFDFGWHMIGLWLFFLVIVALWLREDFSESKSNLGSTTFLIKGFQSIPLLVAGLSAIVVLIWSFLFFISGLYWQQGNKGLSITVFPFAYWKAEDALQNGSDQETQSYVLRLYRNHYRVWDAAARSSVTSPTLKAQYLQKAIELDPLSQHRYLPYLQNSLLSQEADMSLGALNVWLFKKNAGELDEYSYDEQGAAAKLAINQANILLMKGQIDEAIELYKLAYLIQPTQFSSSEVLLFSKMKEISFSQMAEFLAMLEYSVIFPHAEKLYDGSLYHLQVALRNGNSDQAKKAVAIVLPLQENWRLAKFIEAEWSSQKTPNELVRSAFENVVVSWEKYTQSLFNYDVKQQIGMNVAETH